MTKFLGNREYQLHGWDKTEIISLLPFLSFERYLDFCSTNKTEVKSSLLIPFVYFAKWYMDLIPFYPMNEDSMNKQYIARRDNNSTGSAWKDSGKKTWKY